MKPNTSSEKGEEREEEEGRRVFIHFLLSLLTPGEGKARLWPSMGLSTGYHHLEERVTTLKQAPSFRPYTSRFANIGECESK